MKTSQVSIKFLFFVFPLTIALVCRFFSPLFCEYDEQKCNEAVKKVNYYKNILDLHGETYSAALRRVNKYFNLCEHAKEQVTKIVSNDYGYWTNVENINQSERMTVLIRPCRKMIDAIERLDGTIEYNRETYLKIKHAHADGRQYCKRNEGEL
ncbi:MAG: hypothetical protein LBH33_02475 [Endomicrobium sp.]|jgi:hypothetical protein|nr:hypothetical protein [Endomicrobium sp.]